MRLAKGFFLPVFVAQIGDLPLPCTIGRASDGHRAGIRRASDGGSPGAFFKERRIFEVSFSFMGPALKVFTRILKKMTKFQF